VKPFKTLTSKLIALPVDHVDTDQIIPARFLKVVDKHGLGAKAFHDWRYLPNGEPNPEFVLNRPEARGAQILLAGENFGCGSSREHAPWALLDFGFRAVISTSIADIFSNNALKNGLLPVVVSKPFHQTLCEWPDRAVTIDLQSQEIRMDGGPSESFVIESFARFCLLSGKEPLDFLLDQEPHITAFEETRV